MPPATAASKLSATLLLLGERRELYAVARKQRLVGGDDRLAGGERGLDRALGGIAGAADELDEDVDRRDRAASAAGSSTQRNFFRSIAALLAARAGADRDDLDRAAAARDQLVAPPLQQIRRTADAPTVPSPARPIFSGSAMNAASPE